MKKKLGHQSAQKQIRIIEVRFFATAKPVAPTWEVGIKREPLSRWFIAYWKK
jgi:hypothetical protein